MGLTPVHKGLRFVPRISFVMDHLLAFRVKSGTILSDRLKRLVRNGVQSALERALASGDADVLIEDDDEYEDFINDLQVRIARADIGESSFRCTDLFGIPVFDVQLIVVADGMLHPESIPCTPPRHDHRPALDIVFDASCLSENL